MKKLLFTLLGMLLLGVSGCKTVPVSNGTFHMREFSGSYRYKYLTSEKEGDSVLLVGKVHSPEKRSSTIVEFRSRSMSDSEMGLFAYCNENGNFEIKLKKDSYDIYTNNDKFEIGIWLRDIGYYGNKVELRIYPQFNIRNIY